MQLRTPDRLQREFQIPAEAGRGRAIPRVLLAYRGPNKKEFLSTIVPMIVHHALPEHGQHGAYTREVAQHDLAAAAGLSSRSSFTRRLSLFATAAEEWGETQRKQWSDRQKAIAAQRGRNVREGSRRHKGLQAHLVNRRRGFATPNRYSLRLPVATNPEKPAEYRLADLAEILKATPATWWDDAATGARGFKDVPEWVWHAKLPVSDTARLVMTYYILCGLLDDVGAGHIRGEVHPKQETTARALGISVKSVYNANREWEKLGIIRVAHPKPTKTDDGRYVRGPARIVYLPCRQLSREEAAAERQRLLAAVKRLRDTAIAHKALDLAGALLDAYTGKEHALHVFWRDLRKKLLDSGIQRGDVNLIVPPDLTKA